MQRYSFSRFLALPLSVLVLAGLSTAQSRRVAVGPVQDVHGASDKIHPQMLRLLQERGPAKAWVFLRDKALETPQEIRAALQRAEADLSPRQRQRRELRRSSAGLVDLLDVPVSEDYVAAIERTGVQVVTRTSWLNAVSVHGGRRQLEAVADLDFVDRIEPVRRGVVIEAWETVALEGAQQRAPGDFYGASYDQLHQINLPKLHHRGFTGEGVVVGILDTGFHRGHEAFNQPGHVVDVIAEFDFINNDSNTGIEGGDAAGQHSHGTYILGCIGSYFPTVLVGGAYDASFVLAKTEDTTNEYQQEEDFYVSGLQFIEANGADLATSSLGYIDWYTQADLDGLTAVTTVAVNMATANGLICLTAAGNSGHDADPMTSALIAPADALQVLTIGAADSAGTIASFSSDGPSADGRVKPELLARGVSTATVCAFTDTGCLTGVNGTSLSTPLMAAAVACMVQARPDWSVNRFRKELFESADYFVANGTYDPMFVLGYGFPNIDRATFPGKSLPVNEVPDDVSW